MAIKAPVVPEYITVHLGAPDSSARNITVPFIEYIKNVASGEIYSTWPTDAIKANVLAQISFALNRIYNEWYRSKGYEFDITSTSQYDQSFVENRQFFETISVIVDDLFNNYIRRTGQVQPLYASYCDGKNTKCEGLSQWGSVELARRGLSPIEILKYYYGDDIEIVYNAPVSSNILSYPGYELRIGDYTEAVRMIKIQLNRIAKNYPAIPVIQNLDPLFNVDLENSIKTFQSIFNLGQTGTINKSTWYKIKYLYNAVKKITSLYSEGISMEEVTLVLPYALKRGDSSIYVRSLNYYLNVISYFNSELPFLDIRSSDFTDETEELVRAFQQMYGLEENGIVDNTTWGKIREVYFDTLKNIPIEYLTGLSEIYPGSILSYGMNGNSVILLQRYLYLICRKHHNIPGVKVNGIFDNLTLQSVRALQERFGQEANGKVGPITWYNIIEYAKE